MKRRDLWMAVVAAVAVLMVLAIGFSQLGPRAGQRAIRADQRRVADLRSIAQEIHARQTPLPALTDLPRISPSNLKDPVTNVPYEYHPRTGVDYELCAIFATDSPPDEDAYTPRSGFWRHVQGRRCFSLDSSREPPY